MSANTFNIKEAHYSDVEAGKSLNLLLTPQPKVENGVVMTSPFIFPFSIPDPTSAQRDRYQRGAAITLSSDL